MTLLTVRQAASRLGVGYSTLKHWIYEGRVRTTQTPGGHHRIADTEVDRLTAHNPTPDRPARATSVGGFIVALSGRNRLRGYVEEVRTDGLLAQVRLRIGNQTLTAIITSVDLTIASASSPRRSFSSSTASRVMTAVSV